MSRTATTGQDRIGYLLNSIRRLQPHFRPRNYVPADVIAFIAGQLQREHILTRTRGSPSFFFFFFCGHFLSEIRSNDRIDPFHDHGRGKGREEIGGSPFLKAPCTSSDGKNPSYLADNSRAQRRKQGNEWFTGAPIYHPFFFSRVHTHIYTLARPALPRGIKRTA